MAGEWRNSTWGEEISLQYGKALRDYDKASGKFRVFGSNGPIGWTLLPLASGPGVILGRKGAYRGIEYSRAPFFVIDTAYYVVPKSELDMRWLYYAIKYHRLGEIDDGSPIPSTTRSAVYVRGMKVPPLAEQKAIAAVLGALDDKIELNRRMNATLEAMARALFQSWFVDFDPVRAKLDARPPAGLDPAALFPATFQDSPLGPIPQGWEVKTADEVSQVGIGKTPPRKEHQWFSENSSDVPWMSIRDLGNAGVFISHTSEFLTTEAVEKFRVRRIPDNTVVLSFKLTMGRVAITDGEMLSNEAIAHFLLKPETPFGSAYLYCYLKGFGYDQLGSTSSIATAINSDMVRGIRILVPPKGIADSFEQTVRPLFTQMKNIQNQSRTLATLRDTLLPKLLSGELSVADGIGLAERVATL